ncbi:hypothetical protein HK104_000538, partial [Borealophlyctis nickersoniae]
AGDDSTTPFPATSTTDDADYTDPLTLYERKITSLQTTVDDQSKELYSLRNKLENEFVPKGVKEGVEAEKREAEAKLETLTKTNETLSTELAATGAQLAAVEKALAEKEEQYKFLIGEYNELCEAVAVSFDKKVLKSDT